MAIKPILFSTPMIKSLRAGIKHMTRRLHCSYEVGDILWVREAWQVTGWDFSDGEMVIRYGDSHESFSCDMHDPTEDSQWMINKVALLEKKEYIRLMDADDPESTYIFTDKKYPFSPSIHMPKEACRMWLEVTDIRQEPIKDISESDAIAEGVEKIKGLWPKYWTNYLNENKVCESPVESFFTLIQSLHGKSILEENKVVYVISFKEVEKPKDFILL